MQSVKTWEVSLFGGVIVALRREGSFDNVLSSSWLEDLDSCLTKTQEGSENGTDTGSGSDGQALTLRLMEQTLQKVLLASHGNKFGFKTSGDSGEAENSNLKPLMDAAACLASRIYFLLPPNVGEWVVILVVPQ